MAKSPLCDPVRNYYEGQVENGIIMNLTSEEQAILAGGQGQTLKKCLQSLVQYGEVYHADRMVPITSGHVAMSGGSNTFGTYLGILIQLAREGARFKVPTTINPHYMRNPPGLLERILFKRQAELEQSFAALGGIANWSCAPYFGANVPKAGDILAWAESSAVAYANSIIGARTNRNSCVMDVFSAVLGVTPNFGFLLDEHRRADWDITVNVQDSEVDYALLGYLVGEKVMEKVPFIRGLHGTPDDFKNMGAAMAAAGAVGLYHVEGVTPEARLQKDGLVKPDAPRLTVTSAMLDALHARLARGRGKINLVFVGCPHLTLAEIARIARALEGTKVRKNLWLNSAPGVLAQATAEPWYPALQQSGAWLVSICPFSYFNSPSLRPLRVLTNSGKMRYYSPIFYGTLLECLQEATGGVVRAI